MPLIDTETLKSRIGELCINNDDMFSEKAYERIIGVIEAMPTVEPKRSHWKKTALKYFWQCESCHDACSYHSRYCPNCGALMLDEPHESEVRE